jgi:hypothetical protein
MLPPAGHRRRTPSRRLRSTSRHPRCLRMPQRSAPDRVVPARMKFHPCNHMQLPFLRVVAFELLSMACQSRGFAHLVSAVEGLTWCLCGGFNTVSRQAVSVANVGLNTPLEATRFMDEQIMDKTELYAGHQRTDVAQEQQRVSSMVKARGVRRAGRYCCGTARLRQFRLSGITSSPPRAGQPLSTGSVTASYKTLGTRQIWTHTFEISSAGRLSPFGGVRAAVRCAPIIRCGAAPLFLTEATVASVENKIRALLRPWMRAAVVMLG